MLDELWASSPQLRPFCTFLVFSINCHWRSLSSNFPSLKKFSFPTCKCIEVAFFRWKITASWNGKITASSYQKHSCPAAWLLSTLAATTFPSHVDHWRLISFGTHPFRLTKTLQGWWVTAHQQKDQTLILKSSSKIKSVKIKFMIQLLKRSV